jgi:hypothetical protein
MSVDGKTASRMVSIVFRVGWVLVFFVGFGSSPNLFAETVTNRGPITLEQKMRSVIEPEIHIRMPDQPKSVEGLLAPIMGQGYASQTVCSNQASFVIRARNVTMLELVDLIFFLSDTTYAFDKNGLIVASTNMPTVHWKQDPKREKELIAKLKKMSTPEVFFIQPAKINDFVDFFYQAAVDYDDPELPVKLRGINLAIKNPQNLLPFEERKPDNKPRIHSSFSNIYPTLYETLTNCCTKVGAQFTVRDNTLVIYPASETNGPVQKLSK